LDPLDPKNPFWLWQRTGLSMSELLDTIDPRLLDLRWASSLSDDPIPSLIGYPPTIEAEDCTSPASLEVTGEAIPGSRRASGDVLHLLGHFELE
jgi:hypothetical protein